MKSLLSSQKTQGIHLDARISPAFPPCLPKRPRRPGVLGFVLVALLGAVLTASTQVWYPAGGPPAGTAPSALAGSATAQTLIMGTFGPIYISTNYGSAWTVTTAPSLNWEGIAASADATKIYAVPSLGPIYSSTDSGQTWAPTGSPATNWYAVACSADGGTVLAAGQSGPLFLSTDAGAHWAQASAPSNFWTSVCSSADGSRLAAGSWDASGGGQIYVSTNSGAVWSLAPAPDAGWKSMACSSDGLRIIAGAFTSTNSQGTVSLSTNGGQSWFSAGLPLANWTSVASSGDGSILAAGNFENAVYFSTNAGANWFLTEAGRDPGNWSPFELFASKDGFKLAVLNSEGTGPVCWALGTASPASNGPAWALVASSTGFNSLACSADGRQWLAGSGLPGLGDGQVFLSTNSAAGWTSVNSFQAAWASVASSANGTILAGLGLGLGSLGVGNPRPPLGAIVVSSNSGLSWTITSAPTNTWSSLALSADGTKMAAAVQNGGIYFSTNSGLDWALTSAPSNAWSSVALSADGTRVVAAAQGGGIYTSTNSGGVWSPTSAAINLWTSVASSADGSKLAAGALNGGLYLSADAGATWTRSSAPLQNWYSLALSADGTQLAAGAYGLVFVSTDSGATWSSTQLGISPYPVYVAASADGKLLVAASLGILYRSPGPTQGPAVQISGLGDNVTLSWTIPSTNLVLQQSSNLLGANWTAVGTAPVLNLTNLQNQVVLPAPSGNAFYRLLAQ